MLSLPLIFVMQRQQNHIQEPEFSPPSIRRLTDAALPARSRYATALRAGGQGVSLPKRGPVNSE